jgi:hypothetical protein
MILIQSVFFYFLDCERGKEGVFLYYFPSIQMKLRIHCPLSFIQDVETEVVGLI